LGVWRWWRWFCRPTIHCLGKVDVANHMCLSQHPDCCSSHIPPTQQNSCTGSSRSQIPECIKYGINCVTCSSLFHLLLLLRLTRLPLFLHPLTPCSFASQFFHFAEPIAVGVAVLAGSFHRVDAILLVGLGGDVPRFGAGGGGDGGLEEVEEMVWKGWKSVPLRLL
jgi:hypothetical protein